MRLIYPAIQIVTSAMLSGCSVMDPKAPFVFYPTYTFGFTTLADFEPFNPELYMQRNGELVEIGFAGHIGVKENNEWGNKAITANAPNRIPDEVIMKWGGRHGTEESQTISLAGVVPDSNNFHGVIWFIFLGDRWRVTPLNEEQTRWRVSHDKGETPIDQGG